MSKNLTYIKIANYLISILDREQNNFYFYHALLCRNPIQGRISGHLLIKGKHHYLISALHKPKLIYMKKQHTITHLFIGFGIVAGFYANGQALCGRYTTNEGINPLKNIHINIAGTPVLADIDNDGDRDLFIGVINDQSRDAHTSFYRNDGSVTNPMFVLQTINPLEKVSGRVSVSPVFADIDGDKDLDCFIADGYSGGLRYYENTGTSTKAKFEKQSAGSNPLRMVRDVAFRSVTPAFADIDNDGDLDCLVSDDEGNSFFYKNNGSANKATFQLMPENNNLFSGLNKEYVTAPSFYDFNKDGLTDLFIANKYFKNTGTTTSPVFTADIDGPRFEKGIESSINWADLNNDGIAEAITGTSAGALRYQTTAPDIHLNITGSETLPDAGMNLYATASEEGTLQWKKDGMLLNAENSNQLKVSENGNYTVEINSKCGNAVSAPVQLVSKNNGSLLQVTAYPNPSKSEFVINLAANTQLQESFIQITDVQGKIVSTQKVSGNYIRTGKDLKPGIYMLKLVQDNKVVSVQKLIKE